MHHTLGDGMSMVAVGQAVLEAVGGGQVGMALGGGDGGGGGGKSPADAVVKSANRGLLNFSAAEVGGWVLHALLLFFSPAVMTGGWLLHPKWHGRCFPVHNVYLSASETG